MIDFIKNLDFEKLKVKVLEKGKPLGIAAVCFVAVFAAGYGVGQTGQSGGGSTSPSKRSNYTTNSNSNTNSPIKNANSNVNSQTNAQTQTTPKTSGEVDPNNCNIKGSKSKIYHMPGGSFYNRTNPVACFNTEEEAQAAGYNKSSR